jgi:hypothetical protein
VPAFPGHFNAWAPFSVGGGGGVVMWCGNTPQLHLHNGCVFYWGQSFRSKCFNRCKTLCILLLSDALNSNNQDTWLPGQPLLRT